MPERLIGRATIQRMRKLVLSAALLLAPLALSSAIAQTPQPKPMDLREVLMTQLHSTHDKAEWFVPLDTAVAGLTPDQARWTPKAGGPGQMHSVAQLVAHLVYWNERSLEQLRGEKPAAFSGNNEDTFVGYDVNKITAPEWTALVARFDHCMTGYEDWVKSASDADLAKAANLIAHVGAHNAYHLGEIVYVRKLQGSWDPSKGVK